jgi:hypothetical protein
MGSVAGREFAFRFQCGRGDYEIGVVARMPADSSLDSKIGGTTENRNRNLNDIESVQPSGEVCDTALGLICLQTANDFIISDRREREPLTFGEVHRRRLEDLWVLLLENFGKDVRIE